MPSADHLESAMLTRTRTRMLAAAAGDLGWAHPYASPFVLYADGGTGDADGDGQDGDDGADDTDGQDDDADEGDDSDGDGNRDGADEDQLGDKGKKALRELRRENRRLKSQLRQQDSGQGRKPPAKDGDQGDDDADSIRERAREEARAEVWHERVEAAAIAAAAGRLANPARVAQLLGDDLADVPKDDKGRPDKAAISELIDDLLDSDPYLAAPATGDRRRFQGDADSGARKKTKKSAASLGEAVAARLAGKTG